MRYGTGNTATTRYSGCDITKITILFHTHIGADPGWNIEVECGGGEGDFMCNCLRNIIVLCGMTRPNAQGVCPEMNNRYSPHLFNFLYPIYNPVPIFVAAVDRGLRLNHSRRPAYYVCTIELFVQYLYIDAVLKEACVYVVGKVYEAIWDVRGRARDCYGEREDVEYFI